MCKQLQKVLYNVKYIFKMVLRPSQEQNARELLQHLQIYLQELSLHRLMFIYAKLAWGFVSVLGRDDTSLYK
jgi:hypothetical protein